MFLVSNQGGRGVEPWFLAADLEFWGETEVMLQV